jgi:hypothetical protein
LHCAWYGSGVVIVIAISPIIGQILVLPVGLCTAKSLPYSFLDNIQVNLRIVWQDTAVQFDFFSPV